MKIALYTDDKKAFAQAELSAEDLTRVETVDVHGDFDLLILWHQKHAVLDAVEMCRAAGNQVPIIAVVGCNTSPKEARSILMAGADDLMRHQVDPAELRARIGAVIRRAKGSQEKYEKVFGPICIDHGKQRVFCHGRLVKFTSIEYRILEALAYGLSKKHALYRVLYRDDVVQEKIIDVIICKIRKKIERAGVDARHIVTIWGDGYRLVSDPDETLEKNSVRIRKAIGTTWRTPLEISETAIVEQGLTRQHLALLCERGEIECSTTRPLAYRIPSQLKITHQGAVA